MLADLSKTHQVILTVFGSAYALKDVDISKVSTVLFANENNEDSMTATAKALTGQTKISGRLPVSVNQSLKAGDGIEFRNAKDPMVNKLEKN